MRTLTLRELNRSALARQLLLERRQLSVPRAIERLVALQAQWPPAPYIGLWSRLEGFRREQLERLLERGEVLKVTAMRQTLHLLTRRDYGLVHAALDRRLGYASLPAAAELAPWVRTLAGAGPVTTEEVLARLKAERGVVGVEANRLWRGARVHAHLAHHHETALWKPRRDARFVALAEPEALGAEQALARLVRRYLAAFGPATQKDLHAWSMLPMPPLRAALELAPLRRFRDEQGRELYDLARAPLPPPDTPAPIRFLPKWDNVLLAWADRRRILPEEYRRVVIGQNGDVAQTFLVDGFVAGTWRLDGGRVRVAPFEPLPRLLRRPLADEAHRLEAWLRE